MKAYNIHLSPVTFVCSWSVSVVVWESECWGFGVLRVFCLPWTKGGHSEFIISIFVCEWFSKYL